MSQTLTTSITGTLLSAAVVGNLISKKVDKPSIKETYDGTSLNVFCKRDKYKCLIEMEFTIESECKVKLSVYDMYGKLVKNLYNDVREEGLHNLAWKSSYSETNPGPFYIKLEAGEITEVKKVLFS